MRYVIERFSEPSTYGAISAMLAGLGYVAPNGMVHTISIIGLLVFGVIGVVLKEGWYAALDSGDVLSVLKHVEAQADGGAPGQADK